MQTNDRNGNHGGTILHLVRPRFGQAAGNPASPPRLLDQVRELLRARHYSVRTERAYVGWIRRFIRFHGNRHPEEMAEPEIGAYLSRMAEAKVSASTQNQALAALLFLYQQVLGRELEWLGWRTATTSVPFRNCSAIATSRPRFTRTCSTGAVGACAVPSTCEKDRRQQARSGTVAATSPAA